VLGLGCEVNAVSALMTDLGVADELPVASYTIQDAGGTAAAIAHGEELVRGMAQDLRGTRRETVGVEHLVLGLQCGGSDAWSGLTANPALGVASDLLVAAGGTSVLGETPEVYGAEQMLAERAVRPDVGRALLDRITWWEEYTASQGTSMDGNPSPGNKEGGITTILEKSLGAVAKAGHSPLAAVCGYAEPVPRPGLVFMDTPGYDPVSVTGMVAGGANLICFTTGRGSVFGSRPVPTVKLGRTRASRRGWPGTSTSTAVPSSSRACRSRTSAGRCTTCSWRPRRAAAVPARSWGSAARSWSRGSWAPSSDAALAKSGCG